MATKPIKFLELHHTMTQFLRIVVSTYYYGRRLYVMNSVPGDQESDSSEIAYVNGYELYFNISEMSQAEN